MLIENEKPVPGTPDRALEKAASLSTAKVEISWLLNSQDKKIGTGVAINGYVYSADNNTRLITAMFNEIARLNKLVPQPVLAPTSWFDSIPANNLN